MAIRKVCIFIDIRHIAKNDEKFFRAWAKSWCKFVINVLNNDEAYSVFTYSAWKFKEIFSLFFSSIIYSECIDWDETFFYR